MKVALFDILTGETRVVENDVSAFNWAENNWSCDCNRGIYFEYYKDESDSCIGSKRFLVIDAEGDFEGYTKVEFLKECNSEMAFALNKLDIQHQFVV